MLKLSTALTIVGALLTFVGVAVAFAKPGTTALYWTVAGLILVVIGMGMSMTIIGRRR